MPERVTTTMYKMVITPRRITDSTAMVGIIIDTQGYNSVEYDIVVGTMADVDATFAVLLEDGDNAALTDGAPVDDAFMVSQTDGVAPELAASFNFGDDGEVRKLEYIGTKRYTRLTITPTGNTGNADLAAGCRLGSPQGAVVVQTPS